MFFPIPKSTQLRHAHLQKDAAKEQSSGKDDAEKEEHTSEQSEEAEGHPTKPKGKVSAKSESNNAKRVKVAHVQEPELKKPPNAKGKNTAAKVHQLHLLLTSTKYKH